MYYLLSENHGHGLSSEWVLEGYEMSVFIESILNYKNGVNPSDFGNPFVKSIVKSSQTQLGIGRGWSNPAEDKVEYLCCWQMAYLAM